ncbi:MAG: hypothetical protein ACLFQX_09375 [Candidatus Kapaibacterium sp.]
MAKDNPKDPLKAKQDKLYSELMKREILEKIKSRIENKDSDVMKTLKIYLDENNDRNREQE